MLTYTGSDEATRADLVHQVLDHGLERVLATGAVAASDDATNAMVDPADRWTCEYDLILASGLFEEFGYVWHYPENAWAFCGHREGLRHFVRYGWRDAAQPHAGLRPLVVLVHLPRPRGRAGQPLRPLPGARGGTVVTRTVPVGAADARAAPAGTDRWPAAGRACSPGSTRDGIVDDTVVAYVRELSRFADVYYLADCAPGGRRARQARAVHARPVGDPPRPSTTSAPTRCWLATWSAGTPSTTYDEMLLANDSSYLLRPLDEVFDRMDAAARALVGTAGHRRRLHARRPERLGRRLRVETWRRRPVERDRGGCPTCSTSARTSWRSGRR